MFLKNSSNPETLNFYKPTFFVGKNVLIVMVPVLINKDMFEPSYNDLKFMDQSCNYDCTNLITEI